MKLFKQAHLGRVRAANDSWWDMLECQLRRQRAVQPCFCSIPLKNDRHPIVDVGQGRDRRLGHDAEPGDMIILRSEYASHVEWLPVAYGVLVPLLIPLVIAAGWKQAAAVLYRR